LTDFYSCYIIFYGSLCTFHDSGQLRIQETGQSPVKLKDFFLDFEHQLEVAELLSSPYFATLSKP